MLTILILMLSAVGFILSVIAHLSTFAGYSPLVTESTWSLNLGLWLVWLPLLTMSFNQLFSYANEGDVWKVIPPFAPMWSKNLSVILLLYAFFNFIYVMTFLNHGGFPAIIDGQYVLNTYNYGPILKVLTEAEYHLHEAYLLRAGSGHWMFMYLYACVTAYSRVRQEMAAGESTPNTLVGEG